jgi:hypothetical protein
MRIDEIISTQYKDTEFKRPSKKNAKPGELGKGRYSAVSSHDDFSVDKTYKKKKENIENDPYYIYIKTIADNNLAQKNPYFPRVYSVESGKIDDKTSRPKFNIERLTPINHLSDEVLYALGKRVLANKEHYDHNFQFNLKSDDPAKTFSSAMNRALHQGEYSEIKDPELIEALKIIVQIRKQYPQCKPDIHSGNIMVRPTPHGPQIVITDPLH